MIVYPNAESTISEQGEKDRNNKKTRNKYKVTQ